MSASKKRKSDIHVDACAINGEQPPKKEKPWFQEQNVTVEQQASVDTGSRRKTWFGGLYKKLKSSSSLKDKTRESSSSISSNLDAIMSHNNVHDATHHSESSVTSTESANSSALVPRIGKNADLRAFVNRDSFTPVPPPEQQLSSSISLPHVMKSSRNRDDTMSLFSNMSSETSGRQDEDDFDNVSMTSSSSMLYCTPARLRRDQTRMSTRSVPGNGLLESDEQPALFRSLCNSVCRAPSTLSDGGLVQNSSFNTRRSMRMQLQRRILNASSMEDVPEEEALASGIHQQRDLAHSETAIDADQEEFVDGRQFFSTVMCSSREEITRRSSTASSVATVCDNGRLSTNSVVSSDQRPKTPASVGRRNSMWRRYLFGGNKSTSREDVGKSYIGSPAFASRSEEISDGQQLSERRMSVISFSDTSVLNGGANVSQSATSMASSSGNAKMRKNPPSSSNLSQRISAVFRRGSTSKDDEGNANRRHTLTGYSSTSSGIGNVTGDISDAIGGKGGRSISRTASKREDEAKKERVRRFIERVKVADVTAQELLRRYGEVAKRREQKEMKEKYDTQLNESDSSNISANTSSMFFDVVALDVNADGKSFSGTSATIVDDEMTAKIRYEIKNSFRQDMCGTLSDCNPDVIFICPQSSSQRSANPNDSQSASELHPSLLPNVRNAVMKSIELWNQAVGTRSESTLLIYPMFCSSDVEWDAQQTVESIFNMLDAILNTKKWKKNGRCILAGVTENNVKLLRNHYEKLKMSLGEETKENEDDVKEDVPGVSVPQSTTDEVKSVISTSSVFLTNI